MNLKQLYYFIELSKTEHLRKASEKLYISEPTLSVSIKNLENELGIMLFDRVGRNLKLNKSGEFFLKYVESSINTLEYGIEELKKFSDSKEKVINIGYIYSVWNSLLSKIVNDFYKIDGNKDIKFNFIQSSGYALIDDLVEGKVDLALSPIKPNGIYSVKLIDQELFLYVNKSHRLANREEVDLEEIKDEIYVAFNKRSGIRDTFENLFKELNLNPVIKYEVPECNAALSLVYVNQAVSIMPNIPAINYERAATIKLKNKNCKRPIYLCYTNKTTSNPTSNRLIDFIIGNYQE